MDYLEKLVGWTKKLIEGSIALLALAVVLQVLLGPDLPFFPVDVVGNIIDLTGKLGAQGLVGLVAIGVLIALFDRNKS
tara:strand:+ start:23 stop:256 length:234 start_codon:yes stop_codon:yes gene_type:complete